MECRRCQFQNIPGETQCLHCGAALVAPHDFPTDPMRPRLMKPTERTSYRMRTLYAKTTSGLRQGLRRLAAEAQGVGMARGRPADFFHSVVVSIVPGLGQWMERRELYAHFLFWTWLLFLFLGVFWMWLVGLAVSVHVTAILDIYYRGRQPGLLTRIAVSLILFFALLFLVYRPMANIIGRLLWLEWIPARTVVYGSADEVLTVFRATTNAHPGDMVAYHQRPGSFAMENGMHGNFVIGEGPNIGYVAAIEGDVITFDRKRLLVNGVPCSYDEAGPAITKVWPELRSITLVVPAGSAFVVADLSTAVGHIGDGPTGEMLLRTICVVSRSDIRGRAAMIVRPISMARIM